jgi:hypothetical protein
LFDAQCSFRVEGGAPVEAPDTLETDEERKWSADSEALPATGDEEQWAGDAAEARHDVIPSDSYGNMCSYVPVGEHGSRSI